MEVITISGHALHGKDSAAIIIKNHLEKKNKKVLIIHYADYLKFICEKYFESSQIRVIQEFIKSFLM